MNNKEDFLADESEDISELFEMATVYSANRNNYDIVLAVNPDSNRIGEPYFKMYRGKSPRTGMSSGVARIEFKTAEFIKEHQGKIPAITEISSKERKELISYLNEQSVNFPKYTNWDVLKYNWNIEYGFDVGSIEEYMNKKFDLKFLGDICFIQSDLLMPDYKNIM